MARCRIGPYTVARAMADYFDDYRRRGGKSVEGIESVVNRNILPALGRLPVTKLTPQRLRDWHRSLAERAALLALAPGRSGKPRRLRPQGCRGRAPPARQRQPRTYLSQSRTQSRLAQRPGAERRCLAAGQAVPVGGSPPRPLSQPDEMARLRNASAGGFRDLVYLALLTGCRYGELCRFKVADYNADVGTLSVRISKGGKMRHVTLTEEASAFVASLVAGRAPQDPLLRRDDGRAWKRAEQVRLMRKPARAPASCLRSASMCCATPTARCSPCGRCRWR